MPKCLTQTVSFESAVVKNIARLGLLNSADTIIQRDLNEINPDASFKEGSFH